jgi:hypothetical protein
MRLAAPAAAVGLLAATAVVAVSWRSCSTSPASPGGDSIADGPEHEGPPAALVIDAAGARPVAVPPAPIAAPSRRDASAAPSEPALMATLREIGGTAPPRSIELAREGQRRFPNSADAPERAFIIVQSLVNLRRFHEARDEAREMVRKYPDNPFALDAQRHLLVYPLDQPSREEMQQRDQ